MTNEIRFLCGNHYPWFVTHSNPSWISGQIPVFTYHGVEPTEFEEELRFLKGNGYESVSVEEFYRFLTDGASIPGKRVLLTFDDGFESVWTNGARLLEQYGFCGAAFIVPTWIGKPGYLNWDEVRDMHESGLFSIQSHSQNHVPDICHYGKNSTQLELEFTQSKKDIESHLPGHIVDHFCYPQGLGSAKAVEMSRRTGYKTNFWSGRRDRSLNRKGDSPFHIVRVKHDYILRLPGHGRRPMLTIVKNKFSRRLQGNAYENTARASR
jgi:peptidoglycan/xylan/chitin deacetylase (PgdA/CDA1 family)